jgi:hypothetical protein
MKRPPSVKRIVLLLGVALIIAIVSIGVFSRLRPASKTYASPTVVGRPIDVCISSTKLATSPDQQCGRDAQQVAANQFCQEEGFTSASGWESGKQAFGSHTRTYKWFDYGAGADGRPNFGWRMWDNAEHVFTSIICVR